MHPLQERLANAVAPTALRKRRPYVGMPLSACRDLAENLRILQNIHSCMYPIGALERRCIRAMESLFADDCRRRIHTILYHRCEFVEELNPVFRKIVERESELLAMTEKFFRRARRLGHLNRKLSPAEAAFSLYAFASGLHRALLREPWRDELKPDVKSSMEVFFNGLREK